MKIHRNNNSIFSCDVPNCNRRLRIESWYHNHRIINISGCPLSLQELNSNRNCELKQQISSRLQHTKKTDVNYMVKATNSQPHVKSF